MFNFSRFQKGERPINDLPVTLEKDDIGKGSGQVQPGPQTKEKRRGDNSFETAKGHIDDAADAARAGDPETANYHLSMAHQYATLGVQNHMMSDFLGKSKALGPKAMAAGEPKAKAKKVED